MIYLALPAGSSHGWGVCGKYLVREMSALADVTLLTAPFDQQDIGDELDYALLKSRVPPQGAVLSPLESPVLQAITNIAFAPFRPGLRGRPTVGYTFFEDNLAIGRHVRNAREHYDIVVAGSTWCEQHLRQYGLDRVTTILQGVDTTLFNSDRNAREYFPNSFVVFSGGKFEFRKGQDLVIRAFKVLQDRHPDVVLVTAWHNFWPFSIQTMRASRHIRFVPPAGDFQTMIRRVLADNGIDLSRVVTLGPRPNLSMARIYKNTDIGLFPNRCEGGTNLVLMEYMACGKPAIASLNSGHKDILTPANCLPIGRMTPITIRSGEGDVALWDEPDLDETIDHLERAYQHRDRLSEIARQGASDMAALTWRRTAAQFCDLFTGRPPGERTGPTPEFTFLHR